jgi:hypothetical protein
VDYKVSNKQGLNNIINVKKDLPTKKMDPELEKKYLKQKKQNEVLSKLLTNKLAAEMNFDEEEEEKPEIKKEVVKATIKKNVATKKDVAKKESSTSR